MNDIFMEFLLALRLVSLLNSDSDSLHLLHRNKSEKISAIMIIIFMIIITNISSSFFNNNSLFFMETYQIYVVQ